MSLIKNYNRIKKEKEDPKKKLMKEIIFVAVVKVILVMLLCTLMPKLNMMEYFLMAQQIFKNKVKINKKEMIGMYLILNVTTKKPTNITKSFKFS